MRTLVFQTYLLRFLIDQLPWIKWSNHATLKKLERLSASHAGTWLPKKWFKPWKKHSFEREIELSERILNKEPRSFLLKYTAKHHPLWWISFGQRTNREKGDICGGALPCPTREREKCRENDIHYSFSKTDRIKMRIGKNREKCRENGIHYSFSKTVRIKSTNPDQ